MIRTRWVRFLLMAVLLLSAVLPAAQARAESKKAYEPGNTAVVLPVHQTVESGLQSFLERGFREAEEARAALVILDIDTLGGELDSALGIGKLIRESSIPTIAFVHGRAASAGTYIAMNAERIVMEPGSSIGAAAMVDSTGKLVDNPKQVSYWVSLVRAAAEMRGRNADIAQAMVDPAFTVQLPQLNRTKAQGEILSLTAEEAVKVGYSEKIGATLDDVLQAAGKPGLTLLHVELTAAEKAAKWLTSPLVRTLLLLVGIAGVAIELFVPGFGLPGILGTLGFGLYFFGHYIAGFAGVEEIVLFVLGLVLLLLEIFLPGFGILALAGSVSLVSGVVLAAYDTGDAFRSLGIAALLALVVIVIVLRIFKHKGVWNKFILKDALTAESGYSSSSSRDYLLWQTGTAATSLRPSGSAMIGEERVDVVTGGEFITAGSQVQVVLVDGTRVVVKKLDSEERGPA
ncbi:hypothetical protein J31TS4_28870 [Paenibacillus sp. J31TS4]|uniref:NfeD family protein n=1 Tax=Paenibacillus sp. J31TS4 TaxID=2807195 RepID=UPI001B144BDD|nr:NfeD family protein [Paenibacillus sp. J31TS4]GIP39607.1 hypothetical protein J31TS4_28870 [Paenibacillus sp. J31TS4]